MDWKKNQVFLPDLSHYEWPCDLKALAKAGCVGVIWKATEGESYHDISYDEAREAASEAGLLWGAYHFGDSSPVQAQIDNFILFAQPKAEDLFCLDFENNADKTMSLPQAEKWLNGVETKLKRPNHGVLYSGNLIKESLGPNIDTFWTAHRLWLAQYANKPVLPKAWKSYWLWQFTDGSSGPTPHTVAGVKGTCDVNVYDFDEGRLKAEWATGLAPNPTPLAK